MAIEPRSVGGSETLAGAEEQGAEGDVERGAREHEHEQQKEYEVVEVCRDPLSAGLGWHPVDNLNVMEMNTYNTASQGEHAV